MTGSTSPDTPNLEPASDIHDRLRRETRQHHLAIESVVPLLPADLTLATYQRHLRRLLGFYRPLEALLLRHVDALSPFELTQRRKAPLLEHDLLTLTPSDESPPPLCTALPRLDEAARALGCLYVVEGATLGGQILLRRVTQSLGLAPGQGASYLAGYGPHTGEMWRRFRRALSAHASHHGGEDLVIQTAQDTFTALQAWLS